MNLLNSKIVQRIMVGKVKAGALIFKNVPRGTKLDYGKLRKLY